MVRVDKYWNKILNKKNGRKSKQVINNLQEKQIFKYDEKRGEKKTVDEKWQKKGRQSFFRTSLTTVRSTTFSITVPFSLFSVISVPDFRQSCMPSCNKSLVRAHCKKLAACSQRRIIVSHFFFLIFSNKLKSCE